MPPGAATNGVEQRIHKLEKALEELQADNQRKGETIAAMSKKTDELYGTYLKYAEVYNNWAYAFGIGVAIITFLVSIYQVNRIKLHQKIIKQGQETVALVNDILGLAKDASTSAMNATRDRIIKDLRALDEHIGNVMTFSNKDNRAIVTSHSENGRLKELFNELTIFEFNNKNLDTQLDATPALTFLKGLKYSQDHAFDKAIEKLRNAYEDPNASTGIKIRSRYWIGHQQNQLGRFAQAEESFSAAFRLAEGAADERRLELMRLNIESKLFKLHNTGIEGLLGEVDELINECTRKNLYEVNVAAQRTKGDILYAVAMSAHEKKNKQAAVNAMQAAKALWKELADQQHVFAKREYLFACIALQEDTAGNFEHLLNEVRDDSRDLYTKCIAHRSKAYYAMIQFMVAKAQNAKERAEDMDTRANFHVGAMHESEWPTSALKRRPVSRQEFQRDIRFISDNGLPIVV